MRQTTQPAKPPKSGKAKPPVKSKRRARQPEAGGTITSTEVFTIEGFCNRLGITRGHVLEMRRRGLKARLDGGKYVRILGRDYLDYVESLPVAAVKPGKSSGSPP